MITAIKARETILTGDVKKGRSRLISETVSNICFEKNKRWINWSGPALIDEYNLQKKTGLPETMHTSQSFSKEILNWGRQLFWI